MSPTRAILPVLLLMSSQVFAQKPPVIDREPDTLTLEAKISLGAIRGRIDHLAIDLGRQRLYVAELGNDTVGVVDLKQRVKIQTLSALSEPQGIAYVQSTDTLYVANAGDGSVRLFSGPALAPAGQIALGSDADNVRVERDGSRVYVGFGNGALAVIDPRTQKKVSEIALKGHPESFRLESSGSRIFVNVPDVHTIAVLDRETNREVASWPTGNRRANFPLALDDAGHVLVVFRHPAQLGEFQIQDGRVLSSVDTCGDSDDVFVDAKRHRVYVICGEGFIDVFTQGGSAIRRTAHLATASGARTGLFVPENDSLYVAVRATPSGSASIWVFRPAP